jgi:VanZ family protein
VIVIAVVSSIPEFSIKQEPFPGCDKVVHFIEYFILGIALRYWSGGPRKLFVFGGIGFGAIDELHQWFVPGRDASVWDFVADTCGVVVGYLVAGRFTRKADND